jgi:hypothetical protein
MGINFTHIRSGDVTGVFLNPGFPDTIYLSSISSPLVVSHNAGATWRTPTVYTPPGFESSWKDGISGAMTGISPDPRDADEAVCYSHATITRTENGGNTFIESSGLFTGNGWGWFTASVSYDVEDPNRFAFFCADVGLLITDNGGLSWDRHTVPWSWYTGGQVSWRGQYAGSIYPQTGAQAIVSSIGMYFDTKLVRTTDEGNNFSIVTNDSENHLFVAHNTDNPNIVYAGNKRSTDGGATFTAIPYLDQYDASIMGMSRSQPNTVYAMARPREQIYRSDDAGRVAVQPAGFQAAVRGRPGRSGQDLHLRIQRPRSGHLRRGHLDNAAGAGPGGQPALWQLGQHGLHRSTVPQHHICRHVRRGVSADVPQYR